LRILASHLLSICTKGRPQDLSKLFLSLKEQNHCPEKILIVESGNSLETQSIVDRFSNILNIQCKFIDVSMVGARNISIDFGKLNGFEFIHFVDDDTELDSNYFYWINQVFQSYPESSGVGGHVLSPNPSKLLLPARVIGRFLDGRVTPFGNGYAFYLDSGIKKVSWLAGCSMSFRISKLMDCVFDEALDSVKSMGEDLHFTYSLSRKSLVYRTAFAKLVHNQSPINRSSSSEWRLNAVKSKFHLYKTLNLSFPFFRIMVLISLNIISSLGRYLLFKKVEARLSAKDYLLIFLKKKYFL
jgi:hypothetical protein